MIIDMFKKWIKRSKNNEQCVTPSVVCNNFMITYENYSAGSEGAGVLKDGFKSKNSALKYLRKEKGELEAFVHGWNNSKGDWYVPKGHGRYGRRNYYCIVEC